MHCLESGDYIGVESSFDLIADTEENVSQWLSGGGGGGWQKEERWTKRVTAKKYPPPIPSKLPWEMKRYCTEDGRLIINLEKDKARRLEYFEARRSEGRLRLDLVQYDVDYDGDEEDVSGSVNSGEKIDGGDCHGGDGGVNRWHNFRVAESEIRTACSSYLKGKNHLGILF